MIILKILFWFIIFYLVIFIVACITAQSYNIYLSYKDRRKDIKNGVIKEPKKEEKKQYNKVWNSNLGVWEIED